MEPDEITINRPAMRLGCVFDRSGSMAGQKIEYAKAAAKLLVKQLSSEDIFCLVAFDDSVIVVVEPSSVASKEELQQKIEKLNTGNMTNIGAGLLKTFELLEKNSIIFGINRLLLLSDGHANTGLVGPSLVKRIAAEVERTGFSVSAFGIGGDYDAELLGQLTANGKGSLYHIDSPDDTPRFSQEEFGDLLAISALDVKIIPVLPSGVTLKEFYGFSENNGHYEIGNLYSGEVRSILMELEVDADALTSSPFEIEIELQGQNLEGNDFSNTRTIKLNSTNKEPKVDMEIAAFADKVRQAVAIQKASEARLNGDWVKAEHIVADFNPTYSWTSYLDAGVMDEDEVDQVSMVSFAAEQEVRTRGGYTNNASNSILSYGGTAWAANMMRGRGSTAKGAMRMAEMNLGDVDKDDESQESEK